jgi:hypothetical protein
VGKRKTPPTEKQGMKDFALKFRLTIVRHNTRQNQKFSTQARAHSLRTILLSVIKVAFSIVE